MGTDLGVLIVVATEAEANQAVTDLLIVQDLYRRLEKIFSRFDPESELSFINARIGAMVPASAEMRDVASRSLVHFRETDGLFDPRIIGALEVAGYARDFKQGDFTPVGTSEAVALTRPLAEDLVVDGEKILFSCRMDFSGIVKGYATDRAAEWLRSRGWKHFLVDSGGDMYAAGRPPETEQWHISIEGADEGIIYLLLSDSAVATSGISRRKWERDGKRFHHLIHPAHLQDFAFDLRTVSVLSPTAEQADVTAKVLFVQDETARQTFARDRRIGAIFLAYSGKIVVSEAARSFCVLAHSE